MMAANKNIIESSWEDLDEEIKFILGRPNFQCGSYARRLKQKGYKCEDKAETEQAMVIHLMLKLYHEHGNEWRNKFNELISKD